MKVLVKQYAKTLYNLFDGKKKNEVEKIIAEFVAVLAENNDLGKIKKIIAEFEKFWNKERGIVEAEITSARGLDKDVVKLLNSYIVKLSGAKEVIMSEKVDKNLLGGVVLRFGDKVVDGSLRNRLEDLKQKMLK